MEEIFGPRALRRPTHRARRDFIRKGLSGMKRILSCMLLAACVLALTHSSARAQGGSVAPSQSPMTPRPFDDPLAPSGWKRYEFQAQTGAVMTVFLPSLSNVITKQHPTEGGASTTSYTYTSVTDTDAYAVSYLVGLSRQISDNPQARASYFDGFWRGFAEGLRRALESRGVEADITEKPARKILVGGFEAQEQEFAVGTMSGTARVVISGGYGYAIVALSFSEKPSEENGAFLKSFALRAQR